MAASDIREREKIAKEIAKTSESIRKKYRALKTGNVDDDIAVKRHLGPIIEPLKKIAKNTVGGEFQSIKNNAKDININKKREDSDGGDDYIEDDYIEDDYIEDDYIEDDRFTLELTPQPKKQRIKQLNVLSDRSPILRKSKQHSLNNALDTPSAISTPLTKIKVMQPITPTMTPTTTTTTTTNENPLAIENVFETTDDSLATSVQHQMQTPEGQEALRSHLGHWAKSTSGLSSSVTERAV